MEKNQFVQHIFNDLFDACVDAGWSCRSEMVEVVLPLSGTKVRNSFQFS